MGDFVRINMLDIFGADRMEKLFFHRFPKLKGKVTVKTVKENCSICGKPTVYAWHYTQDGEEKVFRDSTVCSGCLNRNFEKKISDEVFEMRQESISKKWYHIKEDDQSGFKNFQVISKPTDKALKIAVDYVKALMKGTLDENLLLMGSTGTGKSHLAKTVAKTAKEKGLNVAYIEAVELFNLIKGTFGHDRHNEMLMNEYKSFDLVVIDDIGLETIKQDETSWSVREWTNLINAREGKATVFTTNFDDDALSRTIGPRAFSRMYMKTHFIDLFTEDYRKKLKN